MTMKLLCGKVGTFSRKTLDFSAQNSGLFHRKLQTFLWTSLDFCKRLTYRVLKEGVKCDIAQ